MLPLHYVTAFGSISQEDRIWLGLILAIERTDCDYCFGRHPFFVKVPIGLGKERQEYYMHIDTGSGISWVNCKGRGPITTEVSVPSICIQPLCIDPFCDLAF